jgi:hypothetical protein
MLQCEPAESEARIESVIGAAAVQTIFSLTVQAENGLSLCLIA